MIDRTHPLSITKQAHTLGVSRGSAYYRPQPVSEEDQRLINRIDQYIWKGPLQGTDTPRPLEAGRSFHWEEACRHADATDGRGSALSSAVDDTTSPNPKGVSLFLRDLVVARVHQVWAMDVTYIPLGNSFVYFVAMVDWVTRRILARRLSITIGVKFRLDAIEDALS